MTDMENQENIMQLQMMGQEAQQLEQQLQLIEQHLTDMEKLNNGLDELEKTDNKEILANIGKVIYIPAEIKSKELLVEIGNKNLVKKSVPEAKEIIDEQIKKLISAKQQIIERVEALQMEMSNLMQSQSKENVEKDIEE